jgi:hypothetical protein
VGFNPIVVCLTCREILKSQQRLSTDEYKLLVSTDMKTRESKSMLMLEQCFEEEARNACRLTHHIMLDVGKRIAEQEEAALQKVQEEAEHTAALTRAQTED